MRRSFLAKVWSTKGPVRVELTEGRRKTLAALEQSNRNHNSKSKERPVNDLLESGDSFD